MHAAEISGRIDVTAQYVRNTLGVLTELSLVETPVRGVYLITELGNYVLSYLGREKAEKKDSQVRKLKPDEGKNSAESNGRMKGFMESV